MAAIQDHFRHAPNFPAPINPLWMQQLGSSLFVAGYGRREIWSGKDATTRQQNLAPLGNGPYGFALMAGYGFGASFTAEKDSTIYNAGSVVGVVAFTVFPGASNSFNIANFGYRDAVGSGKVNVSYEPSTKTIRAWLSNENYATDISISAPIEEGRLTVLAVQGGHLSPNARIQIAINGKFIGEQTGTLYSRVRGTNMLLANNGYSAGHSCAIYAAGQKGITSYIPTATLVSLSEPFSWLAPRRFWIPKAAGAVSAPTISDLRAVNVGANSTQWSIDYTFS